MTILDNARRLQANAAAQGFAAYVACLVLAGGHHAHPAKIFAKRYERSPHLALIQKAAVAAGNTSDSLWSGEPQPLAYVQGCFHLSNPLQDQLASPTTRR
jgi:hypothetical protein